MPWRARSRASSALSPLRVNGLQLAENADPHCAPGTPGHPDRLPGPGPAGPGVFLSVLRVRVQLGAAVNDFLIALGVRRTRRHVDQLKAIRYSHVTPPRVDSALVGWHD